MADMAFDILVIVCLLVLVYRWVGMTMEIKRLESRVSGLQRTMYWEVDFLWNEMKADQAEEDSVVEQPAWVDHPIWKTGGGRKPEVKNVVRP